MKAGLWLILEAIGRLLGGYNGNPCCADEFWLVAVDSLEVGGVC